MRTRVALTLLAAAWALAACGRALTEPLACARYQSTTVPILDSTGTAVGVSWLTQCIEWRQ